MCFEQGFLRHDLGCGGTETPHWFCRQCVVKVHEFPICRQRHPLCTGWTPRETEDVDLSMATLRLLATQNIWAPHNHIGGRESPDVEWLETLESPTPPLACPLWRPARQQVPAGENPTNYAPDHQPYDTVPRGSLPPPWQATEHLGPDHHER